MNEFVVGQGFGLYAIVGVIVVACVIVFKAPLPMSLRMVIIGALFLRVAGSIARLFALLVVYHGVGDATGYFRMGTVHAEFFQNFDLRPFFDSEYWWGYRWWGSTVIYWISGIVLSLIGPTILGEFIFFSLLGFLGTVAFVVTFQRTFPAVPVVRYARWVFLFPSLWYWPSSVGKEAVMLLGLGVAVMGLIGRGGAIQWGTLSLGTGLMFLIRPQMAAIFIAAAMLAAWLGTGRRWTVAKSYQGIVLAVVGVAVIMFGLRTTGIESFDLEGVAEYIEKEGGRSVTGGSNVDVPTIGITGLPSAFVNVLFRPFPWESGSPVLLAAAVEMMILWGYVYYRRKRLVAALRAWRSSRFLCLSAAFVMLYTVALGMMVVNIGIIARQRIFLFPFLFAFLEAAPEPRPAGRRRPAYHAAVPPR